MILEWPSGAGPRPRAPGRAVRGLDVDRAHPARVYDYWLGGKDNFAADRAAGDATIAAYPSIRSSALANREFLARAVRYLAGAGIRQFLDIGTGLPAANSTHQVAQHVAPASRIVYVDNDPLVLAHARALLTSGPQGVTAYIDADLRDPVTILDRAAAVLDFAEPVAVMLLAVLHYIPDPAEARQSAARLAAALPPASFMAISHCASDIDPEHVAGMVRQLNLHLGAALHVGRTNAEVTTFFGGLEILPPGVVKVTQWRPGSRAEARRATSLWGGVARKP